MATMAHGLRRKIALMKTLGAILAGGSSILIDAFGLAFPAADTCAAGAESC
jgi:hypothetical protein